MMSHIQQRHNYSVGQKKKRKNNSKQNGAQKRPRIVFSANREESDSIPPKRVHPLLHPTTVPPRPRAPLIPLQATATTSDAPRDPRTVQTRNPVDLFPNPPTKIHHSTPPNTPFKPIPVSPTFQESPKVYIPILSGEAETGAESEAAAEEIEAALAASNAAPAASDAEPAASNAMPAASDAEPAASNATPAASNTAPATSTTAPNKEPLMRGALEKASQASFGGLGPLTEPTSTTATECGGVEKATQVQVVKTISTTITYANGTVQTTTETFIMPATTKDKHTQTALNSVATSSQTVTNTASSGTQTCDGNKQPKKDEARKKQEEQPAEDKKKSGKPKKEKKAKPKSVEFINDSDTEDY